jgi:hypothetical protein
MNASSFATAAIIPFGKTQLRINAARFLAIGKFPISRHSESAGNSAFRRRPEQHTVDSSHRSPRVG